MASKKKTTEKSSEEKKDLIGGELTAAEEKVLDKILNGIIIFVLSWLGLGILLSLGGLVGLWK